MNAKTSRGPTCSAWALSLLLAIAPMLFAGRASAQLPLPLPIPPPNLSLGPPEFPRIPSLPQVLPSNAPTTSGSTQLPVTSATLDAKILIVSADGTEPVLGAIRQAADYEGIPYTLYVASRTPGGFAPSLLSDGGAHGYYQGIVLTTGALGYLNGSTWTSAFDPSEWQTLWDYQARFRVRTAIAYAFPTADLGYGPATGVDATTTPIAAQLTPAGQSVFPYVNATNPLTITRAWTYLAAATGVGTTVLLTDSQSHALALIRNYPDGRTVLSQTFDGNFFLVHSLALSYGLLNWVTGGLFLGERHVYASPQVDDVFIDDDLYGGGTYRLNGADWTAITGWQTLKEQQALTSDLRLSMAFNGEGTTGTYPLDTLTPAAELTANQFSWINHTYSHQNLDSTSYATAYQQITANDQTAAAIGLADFDRRALVTPDVSGLKNPDAMRAAYDAGVRFLVTDTSQPGMDNPTPQAGIYNPYQPQILMVPRRPVNLFYNVTTPTEWTNEYNFIYHSYWGRDLTYDEILDKESDILLQYLLRGEVDPWMFHQTNLRAYDGVHTLLGDLLDRLLTKYQNLFTLPIQSLTHAALGGWMAERMQYAGAGVRASFRPDQGTITLTASTAAVVPVTGLCSASSETYGGQCISHITLAPGQTATYQFASPSTSQNLGVGAGAGLLPGVIAASPNPFVGQTTITFATTRAGPVAVEVYDVTGRRVGTVADETMTAGVHTLRWDGSLPGGHRAASGVYFLRLRSPNGNGVKRLVLMRKP